MKRMLSFAITVLMLISLSVYAFADYTDEAGYDPTADDTLYTSPFSTNTDSENNRAEETTWYFRNYNGMIQMRKWSCTYGYWLTDWIDVGPAY